MQSVPDQFDHYGRPGVFLSICPLPWPLCLGLFGVLTGLLPCPAHVRVAINMAIWFPNSVVSSTGSVVMADLTLTLSWLLHSHSLPFEQ